MAKGTFSVGIAARSGKRHYVTLWSENVLKYLQNVGKNLSQFLQCRRNYFTELETVVMY